MDRNSIIGLLLIGLIMIASVMINKPDQVALEKQRIELESKKKTQDSLNAISSSKEIAEKQNLLVRDPAKTDSLINTANIDKYGAFAEAASGTKKVYTLENDLIKLNLSSKGGSIEEVIVKGYKTWEKKPLVLFRPDSTLFTITRLIGQTLHVLVAYVLPPATRKLQASLSKSTAWF